MAPACPPLAPSLNAKLDATGTSRALDDYMPIDGVEL
jgi:hypothetical protein